MGSSTSKAAKTVSKISATNTAARKYPTRPPPPSSSPANAQRQPSSAQRSPEGTVGPSVHPTPQASSSRDEAINLDSSDPHLSPHPEIETKNPALDARLRDLGPVDPNPTYSPSSTFQPFQPSQTPQPSQSQPLSQAPNTQFQPSASSPSQTIFPSAKQNPAVSLLTARYRLAEEAEREFSAIGRKGASGRRFLDVVTLRQVLVLRDERGMAAGEIEERLGLGRGVVAGLGGRGRVLGVVG